MTTINEDYVSYEVAELLKEKGFNELCFRLIRHDGEIVEAPSQAWNGMSKKQKAEFYLCPTLQRTCKWLREVHNLFIQVEYDPPKFSSDIYKMDEIDEYGSAKHIPPTFANIKSYEEAVEAAIKYCLENLI